MFLLYLLLFIIIIILGYIFGITLLNLIDKKINTEHFKDNNKIDEPIEKSINEPKQDILKNNNSNDILTSIKNEITEILNKNIPLIKNTNNYDKKKDISIKTNIEGFTDNNNSFKEWTIEQKKTQVCTQNHLHRMDTRCTYGVTNYADPKDMSPFDLNIFQLNYPPNMTLQDYINWLYCFIDKEDELPYNHLKNLEKLKLGIELVQEEGILPPPGYKFSTNNSEEYFNKMYNKINEFNIAPQLNSTTASMIGYNYNEYSEFLQNNNLYGLSGELRNPDIGLKKNAKKLYNYINPKDSNNIKIENDYQIYHMKNVEL